eukprot:1161973-Pelagomonas_calceolata.AAC.16
MDLHEEVQALAAWWCEQQGVEQAGPKAACIVSAMLLDAWTLFLPSPLPRAQQTSCPEAPYLLPRLSNLGDPAKAEH